MNILQLKISLNEVKPSIWRRIQVQDNIDFIDLHHIIQDSMGWLDYHLHQFSLKRPHERKVSEIGIPDENGFNDIEILPGWEAYLTDYFSDIGVSALYRYDFGDEWEL